MDDARLILDLARELRRQQSWMHWNVSVTTRHNANPDMLVVRCWSPVFKYTVETQFFTPTVMNLIALERGLRVGSPGRPLRPLAELITTMTDGEFTRTGHGYPV